MTAVLLDLDIASVAKKSKKRFEILKEQTRIRQIFRSGFQIELPLVERRSAGLLKLGEEQPEKDSAKPKIDNVATIVEGRVTEEDLAKLEQDVGLILRVHSESSE